MMQSLEIQKSPNPSGLALACGALRSDLALAYQIMCKCKMIYIIMYIYIPSGRLGRRRFRCIHYVFGGVGGLGGGGFGGGFWGGGLGGGGVGWGGGCDNVLSRAFFLAANMTLSLCFQGGNATLSLWFAGWKCYVIAMFAGWKCYVVAMFAGWKCYVIAMFAGWKCYVIAMFAGWKCYVIVMFAGWKCYVIAMFAGWKCYVIVMVCRMVKTVLTAMKEYRQACSTGTVRIAPAECFNETKVPWLTWRNFAFQPTANQASWSYI